ncbi:MAG: hypothetical protein ACI4SF_14140 [Oscillospiraceae bacterium]
MSEKFKKNFQDFVKGQIGELEGEIQGVIERVDSIDKQLETINSALTEMKVLMEEIRTNSSNTIEKSSEDTVNDSNVIESSQPNSPDTHENGCESLKKQLKEEQNALNEATQNIQALEEKNEQLSEKLDAQNSDLVKFLVSLNEILDKQDEEPTKEIIENNLRQVLKEKNDEIKEEEDEMIRFFEFIFSVFRIDNNGSTKEERKKRAKEIIEKKNAEIGDLKNTVEAKDKKIAEQEGTIKAKENEIVELNGTIAARDKTIDEQKVTIAARDKTIDEQKVTISARDKTIDEQKVTISARDKTIDEQKVTIAARDKTIDEQKKTIAARDKTIEEQKGTIAARDKTIEEQEKTIAARDNTIDEQKETIAARNNTIDALNGIITEYSDATIEFLKIFKLMQSCPSLKELVEDEFVLPAEGDLNIQQQIQFVNCFSDKTYFAECIYKALEKNQRGNGVPLTDSERELIKAVNEYYKAVFDMDWDILDCLCIEKGTKFNKELMKNAKDPMNTFLSEVDYLCVPSLRNLESRIVEKAYIVGR